MNAAKTTPVNVVGISGTYTFQLTLANPLRTSEPVPCKVEVSE